MGNRINAFIGDKDEIIGTIPAFPNGMGDELARRFASNIKVTVRYGDVSSVRFRTIEEARHFPGFEVSAAGAEAI